MHGPVAVIICDAEGRVRSASRGAGVTFGTDGPLPGTSIGEALGATPKLRDWIVAAAERTSDWNGDACVVLEETGTALDVCLTPLEGGGFAVVASPAELGTVSPDDVTQQEWHDIKNQLGGLKLYATFLKKRYGDEEGLVGETAAKIVGGIDAVVAAIAAARRGESTTKGEGK